MKSILLSLFVIISVANAQAKVAGKLDLANPVLDVIVFRELNDGMWLGGAQKTVWKLIRTEDGVELIHASLFWASRPETNSNKVYGPSVGINVGGVVHETVLKIAAIAEVAYSCPPWVNKIGSWTSLDFYGGYRPIIGYDEHHWIYGIGGKVTIPLDVNKFISKSQGGGL